MTISMPLQIVTISGCWDGDNISTVASCHQHLTLVLFVVIAALKSLEKVFHTELITYQPRSATMQYSTHRLCSQNFILSL